jgi:hypothetical protein
MIRAERSPEQQKHVVVSGRDAALRVTLQAKARASRRDVRLGFVGSRSAGVGDGKAGMTGSEDHQGS